MSIQELVIYWHIVRKRLWLIGLLVGVTLGAVLLISYLSKPLYRASASFQVTSPLPEEVTIFNEFRTSTSRDELVYTKNNFLAVLRNEFVVGQVIEELDLDMDIEELLKNLTIESEENSDFLKLRVISTNAELAAAIANTLIERGAQYYGELRSGMITANKEFIQEQMLIIEQELEQAKADLVQFQLENRIGSINEALEAQQVLIRQLNLQLDEALAKGDEGTANKYAEGIARREQELQELIQSSYRYEVLRDVVKRRESLYSSLLDKETEAKLKENEILSAQFIRIIPARVPSRPLPRIKLSIISLAVILSLGLGILIVFVLEYLENISIERDNDDINTSLQKSPTTAS